MTPATQLNPPPIRRPASSTETNTSRRCKHVPIRIPGPGGNFTPGSVGQRQSGRREAVAGRGGRQQYHPVAGRWAGGQLRHSAACQVRPRRAVRAVLRPGRRHHAGRDSPTGKQPSQTAVGLPDLSKHLEKRLRQRESPLLVSLADHSENHPLRVDRRDRRGDRLVDSQAIGVDQREAAAIDRLLEAGDQATEIRSGTDSQAGETVTSTPTPPCAGG